MPFWSGETIKEWIPKWGAINPFDEKKIDCAAYTLSMGAEAYITPDYQVSRRSDHTKKLLAEGQHFIIPPGQFAFLLTEETVRIPPDVLGFISLRTTYKFMGLINVSGFHVDPGFHGKLIYAVYNAGPTAIHLSRGTEMFLIRFADLDKLSPQFTRNQPPVITITPRIINPVSEEILTLQSLSNRIRELESRLFKIEFIGGAIAALLGIIIAVLRFWDFISPLLTKK
jgi:dCTP deaminase